MLKRSVLTLATVFSLIGISEAFGEEQDCYLPAKDMPGNSQDPLGERPKIVVTTNQDCLKAEPTKMGRVFKIQWLHQHRPCPDPDWIWVTTIKDTTRQTDVVTGWIPKG